jgi:hypothetical protein
VRLSKDARTRRYHIGPDRNLSEWYCQVWFGETQHCGDRVDSVVAWRLLAQYRREIATFVERWLDRDIERKGALTKWRKLNRIGAP